VTESFEIPASELQDWTALLHWDLLAMSETEGERSANDVSHVFVDIHPPFDVLGAAWGSDDGQS